MILLFLLVLRRDHVRHRIKSRRLACPVLDRLPEEKNIALAGSVLLKNLRVRKKVGERLVKMRSGARVLAAGRDASEGAVRLLLSEKPQ